MIITLFYTERHNVNEWKLIVKTAIQSKNIHVLV